MALENFWSCGGDRTPNRLPNLGEYVRLNRGVSLVGFCIVAYLKIRNIVSSLSTSIFEIPIIAVDCVEAD
jgi:hypothetical protein